jgi:hypothetical protein
MSEGVVASDQSISIFLRSDLGPKTKRPHTKSWRDALASLEIAVDTIGIVVDEEDRKAHVAAIEWLSYAMDYTLG